MYPWFRNTFYSWIRFHLWLTFHHSFIISFNHCSWQIDFQFALREYASLCHSFIKPCKCMVAVFQPHHWHSFWLLQNVYLHVLVHIKMHSYASCSANKYLFHTQFSRFLFKLLIQIIKFVEKRTITPLTLDHLQTSSGVQSERN